MQKIEVVVRITKDHCPPQEQMIFEWFDLMRNPTDVLRSPGLEINLEHHRVFKHGTEVYMSRYEYGVLSLMAQHPGKLFTKEQIFEAVWHKDSDSYLRAVTSTIGRIRQKIEDDKDHPRYIKTVSNIGYQFVPSSESVRLNRNL
ncbi:MAG: winged helix-turn-helix domain-containing protein [Faecalibacterium prausnitzii]